MKKTYIIPEALVVELNLRTSLLTAVSVTVNSASTDTVNSDEVLTKENTSSGGGTNVWDEEW